MDRPQRTFSTSHLERQRGAHARSDGYGRHRHLYLHDTIRALAGTLASAGTRLPTWLDYGCGKGGFINEINPLGLFSAIAGYDPAVTAFRTHPGGTFDLVTCLDVVDVVEAKYLDAVLQDVAAHTASVALFDCLTRPKADSTLRPHPPFYWTHCVRQHMDVMESRVEFPGMQDFERVVIVAAPRVRSL